MAGWVLPVHGLRMFKKRVIEDMDRIEIIVKLIDFLSWTTGISLLGIVQSGPSLQLTNSQVG